ncbi:MAG: hypothetical protein JAY74_22160 [Candidatus Thiodiazotropha taylori]|nr:hypothetical protein [Candidatus Thiodiazotropha taylori]
MKQAIAQPAYDKQSHVAVGLSDLGRSICGLWKIIEQANWKPITESDSLH